MVNTYYQGTGDRVGLSRHRVPAGAQSRFSGWVIGKTKTGRPYSFVGSRCAFGRDIGTVGAVVVLFKTIQTKP